jgi:hypothetical protein
MAEIGMSLDRKNVTELVKDLIRNTEFEKIHYLQNTKQIALC